MEATSCGRNSPETDHVMSEVHLGCPPGFDRRHTSHFTFLLPPGIGDFWRRCNSTDSRQYVISFDEDGDLVLPRRQSKKSFSVVIQHNITSSIPRVGLQVWRAELVLADFVLHKMCMSSEFYGIVSLELGAGTGLVGILLAQVAETVFLTDHNDEILENCSKNVSLNSGILNKKDSIYVRKLDWMKPWPLTFDRKIYPPTNDRYSWNLLELDKVERASVLLAADVIYNDELTDAFFDTLEKVMSHGLDKVLYLALEKRYNFSLSDLDVVANGYSRFRSFVKDTDCKELENDHVTCFVGKQVDVAQIPQYTRDYVRGDDVELWQIKYMKPNILT